MNKEHILAVVENQKQELVGEDKFVEDVKSIEMQINQFTITSDAEYEEAGALGLAVKSKISEVTDFFSEVKKAAYNAHKKICDKEKEILKPLKNAETVIKKSMGAYALKKEEERKKAEEESKRLAKEEVERKLAEAVEAEKTGDEKTAQTAFSEAEIIDNTPIAAIYNEKPKVKGISTKKDFEITDIDLNKVPVSVMGVVIRPVDTTEVLKLIRTSKGTLSIDGISYKEVNKMSFRKC